MLLVPFHPVAVHLPVALAVLAPLVAGGLLVCWWRGWLPRRVWWVVVGIQALVLGSGIVAMQSGEANEDAVKQVIGGSAIHEHEEKAEHFMLGAGITFALLLGAALIRTTRTAQAVAGASVLAAAVTVWLAYEVGHAGGRLVYDLGAADAFTPAGPRAVPRTPAPAHRDHD